MEVGARARGKLPRSVCAQLSKNSQDLSPLPPQSASISTYATAPAASLLSSPHTSPKGEFLKDRSHHPITDFAPITGDMNTNKTARTLEDSHPMQTVPTSVVTER